MGPHLLSGGGLGQGITTGPGLILARLPVEGVGTLPGAKIEGLAFIFTHPRGGLGGVHLDPMSAHRVNGLG